MPNYSPIRKIKQSLKTKYAMNKRKLRISTTFYINKNNWRIVGSVIEIQNKFEGTIRKYCHINRKASGEADTDNKNNFLLTYIMNQKKK